MAKITRQTQQIFASNAPSNLITAFGTAMTSTPNYTTDVSEIMNANFLTGWSSAIQADKAPYEEDTNGIIYAITKQIAYLYQQGVAEWDANTEYNTGSLVQVVENNKLVIKRSKVEPNIGNPTTSTTYWEDYYSAAILAQKANIELDNVLPAQSFIDSVTGWLIPDYTAGITKSTGIDNTATDDGWVQATAWVQGSAGTSILTINGTEIKVAYAVGGTALSGDGTVICPIKTGDVYKLSGDGGLSLVFYPMRGV
jgi:hypothetical protein